MGELQKRLLQVAEEREVCAVGSELRLTAGRHRDSHEVRELVWKVATAERNLLNQNGLRLAVTGDDPVSKQA